MFKNSFQQRGALHSHILCWFKPRVYPSGYTPLQPVTRTAKGTESKQKPRAQEVTPLKEHEYKEDNIYQSHHVGRIWCLGVLSRFSCCVDVLVSARLCFQHPCRCEMCRPHVVGAKPWNGFSYDSLRIAGLLRSIQSRHTLHQCTTRWLDRNTRV